MLGLQEFSTWKVWLIHFWNLKFVDLFLQQCFAAVCYGQNLFFLHQFRHTLWLAMFFMGKMAFLFPNDWRKNKRTTEQPTNIWNPHAISAVSWTSYTYFNHFAMIVMGFVAPEENEFSGSSIDNMSNKKLIPNKITPITFGIPKKNIPSPCPACILSRGVQWVIQYQLLKSRYIVVDATITYTHPTNQQWICDFLASSCPLKHVLAWPSQQSV